VAELAELDYLVKVVAVVEQVLVQAHPQVLVPAVVPQEAETQLVHLLLQIQQVAVVVLVLTQVPQAQAVQVVQVTH
jgi:hypothetical protein